LIVNTTTIETCDRMWTTRNGLSVRYEECTMHTYACTIVNYTYRICYPL